ncbi:branched-chain amino acid ABC transporter substrate-binding protein [Hydrogenophaga sp. OTU3427]|uniref:branched-chain amino acid ABC transporter substrate-binding protein n=1 Tax=Hydrogenophaga sp. OTU3427 TaxID=3043856 RepID=UPI00313AEB92
MRWLAWVRWLLVAGLAVSAAGVFAQAGETVRIAFIDPLTGPVADIGRNSLRSWQFVAERKGGAGNPAGVRFVIAPFDNKGSPQESLNALKAAIDQGFRYVVQGNGSGVAHVLADAIARHNARRPDRPVLYLNYAATDPALTGERCSYWHFRVEADTAMKVRALVDFLAGQPELRKVYLLNQDYAHGQQVARHFREAVAERLPELQIVGDELHPPFQMRDFQPQIQRIHQSGAQAVVTGNWGEDLTAFIEMMQTAQMRLPLFTYYAALSGAPSALAKGHTLFPVYQVAYHHSNPPGELGRLAAEFRRRHQEDFVVFATHTGITLLGEAMARAGSTDTRRVAEAMEGLGIAVLGGHATLRADDHQLLQGLFVSRWSPVDTRYPLGAEGTRHTFVPLQHLTGATLAQPSRCNMPKR